MPKIEEEKSIECRLDALESAVSALVARFDALLAEFEDDGSECGSEDEKE